MKTFDWKSLVVKTVALLYILLFVYAASSKLFDFANFRMQLAQSPLLSAFADWVSICVIAAEFSIVIFLTIEKSRLIALFAAYALMVMFTAYIYIITNYSAFVPCSCGGILEKMTWDEHFVFNVVFIALAVVAILFCRNKVGQTHQISSL